MWAPAVAAPLPPTANAAFIAYHQTVRPDRPYSPLNIAEAAAGVYVADFGQNMAGMMTLRVACGAPGRVVNLRFGETLNDDGTIFEAYGYWDESNYTCAGTGDEEEYTSLFVQYAFQYVQVTGWPHGTVPNVRARSRRGAYTLASRSPARPSRRTCRC